MTRIYDEDCRVSNNTTGMISYGGNVYQKIMLSHPIDRVDNIGTSYLTVLTNVNNLLLDICELISNKIQDKNRHYTVAFISSGI